VSSRLGGPVDPLFETCAPDDLGAVAKTDSNTGFAVFVPELRDALVQLVELGCEDGVMSTGQTVQESGAVLACALDLATDFSQLSHIWENDRDRCVIPSSFPQP